MENGVNGELLADLLKDNDEVLNPLDLGVLTPLSPSPQICVTFSPLRNPQPSAPAPSSIVEGCLDSTTLQTPPYHQQPLVNYHGFSDPLDLY